MEKTKGPEGDKSLCFNCFYKKYLGDNNGSS